MANYFKKQAVGDGSIVQNAADAAGFVSEVAQSGFGPEMLLDAVGGVGGRNKSRGKHHDESGSSPVDGELVVEEAASRSADGTKHGNSFVADQALAGATGKTTAAGNRAINAVIAEDFPDLRSTHQPVFSPWASTGIASYGQGTQIGYKSLESRADLRNVLVHEELHHRWWNRGITSAHHPRDGSGGSERFYEIIERYERMRGWKK